MRPTADILTMLRLVVPYINYANHVIRVQTGPALGIKSFHRLQSCGHLLGKGWPLDSLVCDDLYVLSTPHMVSWVRCDS